VVGPAIFLTAADKGTIKAEAPPRGMARLSIQGDDYVYTFNSDDLRAWQDAGRLKREIFIYYVTHEFVGATGTVAEQYPEERIRTNAPKDPKWPAGVPVACRVDKRLREEAAAWLKEKGATPRELKLIGTAGLSSQPGQKFKAPDLDAAVGKVSKDLEGQK